MSEPILKAQDIQNILNIMSRVELKGNEAHAYVTCEMKLRMMLKQCEENEAPPAPNGDGDGETQG